MRRKLVVYCEQCGGTELSGDAVVVFHCLSFCSGDCRDDYRVADEERRESKRAVAELATVADVMRRGKAAAKPKRARAA